MVINGRWLIDSPSENITYVIPDIGPNSMLTVIDLLRVIGSDKETGGYFDIGVRYVAAD